MVNPNLLGQRIYIDASALIYAIEVPLQYPGLRAKIFRPFALGQLTLVTSWITLAEVLIHPLQAGDTSLANTYRQFFTPSSAFEIFPVDQSIAEKAADLRALHGFKLPDAIHIATGTAARCAYYVTGDVKWAQAGLPVIQAASI